MSTTTTTTRTITLTDRPPVRIIEADWPEIAHGWDYDGSPYAVRCQSDEWHLRVRQHADGRALVYAVYTGADARPDRRGGELLEAGDNLVEAIKRVGRDLDLPDSTIRECIADLPPVAI